MGGRSLTPEGLLSESVQGMKKQQFLAAVDTLKLYRRADLVDEKGRKLISSLYVDPLPGDHVLNTILKPNTTFLLGRKGTGKSTIFQRAQEGLNQDPRSTWAYIDIKTLYESSTAEVVGSVPEDFDGALSQDSIHRIYIFRSFILELVREIRKQVELRVGSTFWSKIKEAFTLSSDELFEDLDEFIEEIESDKYLDVTGGISSAKSDENSNKRSAKNSHEVKAKVGKDPSIEGKALSEVVSSLEAKRSHNYSQVFIRVFNIRGLIGRLKEILARLKVRHLYIFIDDFSELPKDDMEQVVDTILAPFNNWSDEFIKLKVAVYPGRLYAGDIDLSKVDQVYLDIYRGYGRSDVTAMEEKAVDFTERLVTTRLKFYCKDSPEVYFDTAKEDFWKVLFYACMGNPRILGYILYYCYETSIINGDKIRVADVQNAARRYYEEKIDHYFRLKKFLLESFEERSSIYSLKELFEEFVARAKELRNYRDSTVMSSMKMRPPTSHFHIKSDFDSVVSSLELNFFITKYYEMKDRDGRDVSVYALNYGLCQQEAISFGRPTGKREYRLYFVERIFDYTPIVASYIKVNQEIVCDSCGHRHGHEMLPAIQAFDMMCPKCKEGTCQLVNLSRKYEALIKSVESQNLLPVTELGILKTLHDERKRMLAGEIAAELDCSYQLVGKRGRNLADRDLVKRVENEKGRKVFELSDKAKNVYFDEDDERSLSRDGDEDRPRKRRKSDGK